jgi:hypothetical protein
MPFIKLRKYFSIHCLLRVFFLIINCKVLPIKDHATCGKERFIGIRTSELSLLGSECSGLAENG